MLAEVVGVSDTPSAPHCAITSGFGLESRQAFNSGSRAKHADVEHERFETAFCGPTDGMSDEAIQQAISGALGGATLPYVQRLHLDGFEGAAACGKCWGREQSSRGGGFRWRLIGCGDRAVCPNCAGYFHRMQGSDAWELFEGVAAGAQASGVEMDHLVSCHWLTLPKEASRALHALFWSDREYWKILIDALYGAAREVIASVIIADVATTTGVNARRIKVGGVEIMHAWGSVDPCDPHYHFIVLRSPVACADGRWVAVDADWSQSQLREMKLKWTAAVRHILAEVVDIDPLLPENGLLVCRRETRRLDEVGHAIQTVVYELRPPLHDLWKGLQSRNRYERYDADGRRVVRSVGDDELSQLLGDVAEMRSAMRRVRWSGFLSSRRGKYLPSLGFVKSMAGEEDEVTWRPCGVFKLVGVSMERKAVVMERRIPHRRPSGEQVFEIEEFEVPFDELAGRMDTPACVHSTRGKWVRPPDEATLSPA